MSLDLSFPRRPYVEAYLGGDWRAITGDVRQGKITITRGRKDEGTKPSPGKCSFVLDDGPGHGDGDYSPRNPLGQWYGQLNRNLPVRVGLEVGQDAFARDVASGWGDSPSNGPWTAAGSGSTSVAGGAGVHSVNAAGAFAETRLDGVVVRDVELAVSFTMNVTTVTGGQVEPANLLVRHTVAGNYLARLQVVAGQQMQLRLMVSGLFGIGDTVNVGLWVPGAQWRVKAAVEGDTMMAKAWSTDDPEPLEWQTMHVMPDFDGVAHPVSFPAGSVGVRSGVAAGNTNAKPIVFSYTDFELRLPRFSGEASKLKPATSLAHTDRTVEVECGGLLRRLSRYVKTLPLPITRYIQDNLANAVDHWLLDDPTGSTSLRSGIAGRAPGTVALAGLASPREVIGGGTLYPWSGPALALRGPMTARFPIRTVVNGLNTDWRIEWVRAGGRDTTNGLVVDLANGDGFTLTFFGTPENYLVELFESVNFGFASAEMPDLYDGLPHIINVQVVWTGTSGISLWTDGQFRLFLAMPALANRDPTMLTFNDGLAHSDAHSMGALTLWNPSNVPQIDQTQPVLLGHAGEPASRRFVRLCEEQGIPVTYTGGTTGDQPPATSPPMGPQRSLPVMALLQECVDVDQGSLVDLAGATVLGLRTTRSTVEAPTVATLDYSNQEVAPEFGPVEDDQATLNDVTAKRPFGGGEYRYEQTTGPLNVSDPGTAPGAAGRTDATVTVNVETEQDLPDQAGWRVHLGTVDEPRFPTITVDLAATAITGTLAAQLLDVNVDDKLTVTALDDTLIFEPVRQIVRGYTEVLDTAYRHKIVFNTSPANPYDSGVLDDNDVWLDSGTSTLAEDLDTTETGIDVIHTGGRPWTTDVADFPFDILVSGERMTVTNISLTVTQLFTVVRSVNGVVKSHSTGTPVSLADPIYLIPGGG